jgi:hypothetical protein
MSARVRTLPPFLIAPAWPPSGRHHLIDEARYALVNGAVVIQCLKHRLRQKADSINLFGKMGPIECSRSSAAVYGGSLPSVVHFARPFAKRYASDQRTDDTR